VRVTHPFQAHDDYEHQTAKTAPLGEDDKARITALASDFPALWSDHRTPTGNASAWSASSSTT
jgi:hypothetical protein